MTTHITTATVPGKALVWAGSERSLKELLSYAVGFYQGLFVGIPVQYLGTKEQFFFRVLRDGYQLPEVELEPSSGNLNLDEHLQPCADVQALHETYHVVRAWRFMVTTFSQVI